MLATAVILLLAFKAFYEVIIPAFFLTKGGFSY